MSPQILVSAGEASGDLYAARLVERLRERLPEARFFGCAGPRMQAAGVEAVVDARSLAVVGLVEVLAHIPRIYGEFRRLCGAARRRRPALAVLTDSPDFHLRVASKLKHDGVPVVYLVAPQVWAWRKGRLKTLRRNVDRLLCIFPFEEKFFRDNGVAADYLGHPLAGSVSAATSRDEFFRRHRLPPDQPLIAILPGSRRGEIQRHIPPLRDAAAILGRQPTSFLLGSPRGVYSQQEWQRLLSGTSIRVVEAETWDLLAHCDVALAASGTVTMEAALLGAPLVTFYRVTAVSWLLGKLLVDVPFYSMVNLVAGRKIVPELMQDEMTGERLASEARRLLEDDGERRRMKQELAEVAARLASDGDPMERAANIVEGMMKSVPR
ncbi:MAG: lipid-A-disaccharide synthase [Bryobacteraceae bacterium]|nr:lipid-A-disaccharide synthase [Bryobacteraceae bacterium]